MSSKRIDRRAKRTRDSLADALIDLGGKGDVDALDVGELAEKAGIGRSTFYAHYASKADFIATSFADMIGAAEAAAAQSDPERKELLPARHLFAHVHEARDFALSVFRSEAGQAIMEAGETKMRAIVETNLKRLKPDWTLQRRREASFFVVGGFMGLLRWQIESGQEPRETYGAYLSMARGVLAAD